MSKEHPGEGPLSLSREELTANNPKLKAIFEQGDHQDAERRAQETAERRSPGGRQKEQAEASAALIALHDEVCRVLEKTRIGLTVPDSPKRGVDSVMFFTSPRGGARSAEASPAFEAAMMDDLRHKKAVLESIREELATTMKAPIMERRKITREDAHRLAEILTKIQEISDFQVTSGRMIIGKAQEALNKLKDHE